MIDNPAYKGEWKPKQIDNPNFFEEKNPTLEAVGGVAIEVWTMSKDIQFDNFFFGHDLSKATAFGKASWAKKHADETEIEEARAKSAGKEERERKRKEGGFGNTMEVMILDGLDLVAENVLASIITFIATMVGLIWWCTRGSDDEAANEEDDAEQDEDVQEVQAK